MDELEEGFYGKMTSTSTFSHPAIQPPLSFTSTSSFLPPSSCSPLPTQAASGNATGTAAAATFENTSKQSSPSSSSLLPGTLPHPNVVSVLLHNVPASEEENPSNTASIVTSSISPSYAYYLHRIGETITERPENEVLKVLDSMVEEGKERFEQMKEILSVGPESISNDAFGPFTRTSRAMDMDTKSVEGERALERARRDDFLDLKSLRTFLSSSHLDLSFLEKIFLPGPEEDPLKKHYPSVSVVGMLERNASLIPSLNASLVSSLPSQHQHFHRHNHHGSDLMQTSESEKKSFTEFSSNLVTLASLLPPKSLNTSKSALDAIRLAIELGLPSIPYTTPPDALLPNKLILE